jgi:hypothetical protein
MKDICINTIRFGELATPSFRYIDPAPMIFVELMAELRGIMTGQWQLQKRQDGTFKRVPKERFKKLLSNFPICTINESPYMTMTGMSWTPISKIEFEQKEVRVGDLRVPRTHCFLTNGLVVHNSGAIEFDADKILFLYREEEDKPNDLEVRGIAEVDVDKHKDGPTGRVKLAFQKEFFRFEDLAQ